MRHKPTKRTVAAPKTLGACMPGDVVRVAALNQSVRVMWLWRDGSVRVSWWIDDREWGEDWTVNGDLPIEIVRLT